MGHQFICQDVETASSRRGYMSIYTQKSTRTLKIRGLKQNTYKITHTPGAPGIFYVEDFAFPHHSNFFFSNVLRVGYLKAPCLVEALIAIWIVQSNQRYVFFFLFTNPFNFGINIFNGFYFYVF